MKRGWKRPELLIVLGGLVVAAGWMWLKLPGRPVLDVPHISNIAFHADLREVGFDAPRGGAPIQPLAWDRPVHDEAGVAELVRSFDLTPETLAAEPHADMVSTQSSIHVQIPILDSIMAWSNRATDLWILRQRYMVAGGFWKTYAIVQDRTTTPNTAFYVAVLPGPLTFRGADCFQCHASGPRALRPARPDLVIGVEAAAAFNERIAGNGYVDTRFGAGDPAAPTGPPLAASACVSCHRLGGERGPLYRLQADSIRALMATGAMPRDGRLSPTQAQEIEVWLSAKRD